MSACALGGVFTFAGRDAVPACGHPRLGELSLSSTSSAQRWGPRPRSKARLRWLDGPGDLDRTFDKMNSDARLSKKLNVSTWDIVAAVCASALPGSNAEVACLVTR